jgi:tRNA threonylcarbamoyladenosine biosynthesis protein TsaE
MLTQFLANDAETQAFGGRLASLCTGLTVVHLQGELGVGKTTLARGFLRKLSYDGKVKSPTYTLVESYTLNQRKIHHFDFYRLKEPEELEYMGIRDYLVEDSICLIEWPERGKNLTPAPDIIVQLFHQVEGRLVHIHCVEKIPESELSKIFV